ncbi:class D sortase [Bacillus sp. RO3]|nr:class D sortase [Bacillus sp. RO3]
MNRLVFMIGSIFFIAGISCVIYSFSLINIQEKEQREALAEAKAAMIQSSVTQKENELPLTTSALEYSFSKGEVMGILSIPTLERELPIVSGTDEAELEKGVGHYSPTNLPGQQNRIFLAGHRDTVFKQMGELKIGDKLEIQMKSGMYEYEIFETLIVDETDLSVIQPTAPEEILTLSTCYPFEYLSSTEERYIINARKIE